mmetsp:Transcript_18249/g.33751  ORF Transcript_18249/g.33751 Transcript_18249/m.33751 type:complete len:233 (+) Transcript_18249:13-711(+)
MGDAAATEQYALVPFSYASPFFDPKALPERTFTIAGHDVTVEQACVFDGKGGTELGFGAAAYEASFLLAEYLGRHRQIIHQRSILELGCGVGLVSLSCAKLGASRVLATDGDTKSVSLARRNASKNNVEITTRVLRWGQPCSFSEAPADVILAADVVCFPYAAHFEDLRQTLMDASAQGTEVWIAHKFRDPSENVFLVRLESDFELVKTVPPTELHRDFLLENIHIYCFRRR